MFDSRKEKVILVLIGLFFILLFDRYNNYYNRRISALEKILRDADCESLRGEVNGMKTKIVPIQDLLPEVKTFETLLTSKTIPDLNSLKEDFIRLNIKVISLEDQIKNFSVNKEEIPQP